MAFSGAHVVCATVANVGGQPMMGRLLWSETMSVAGMTTRGAPVPAMFEVYASADVVIAHGSVPDAGQAVGQGDSARVRLYAGTSRNLYCFTGAKLAWASAGPDVHVSCLPVWPLSGAPLGGQPIWSETMSVAGLTTQAAPGIDQYSLNPIRYCFEIASPVADIMVAYGPNPDATIAPVFIAAGSGRNVHAYSGDRLAWRFA